jgi:2-haloacid dehalogenase
MVILFDVNGTLLDTSALGPPIRSIFGRKVSLEEWFTRVLQHAAASTLSDDYRPFGDLAIAVLNMTATAHGITPSARQLAKLRSAMETLPPFPDVKRALRRLQKANFRLAVLTNSAPAALERQMAHSGLGKYFEKALSVDLVQRYKPAPGTYRAAIQCLEVQPSDILMVAAHHWDLLGASRVGCRTAFLSRPGKALLPGARLPTYVARDLTDLADQLLTVADRKQPVPPRSTKKVNGTIVACGIALGALGIAVLPKPR